ncbi:MAG TPA: FAD-dependent oxidoreductase [Polyangia bacterium]|nr:FAD-dependent oxidoreductase [Polyangia bacterium]
MARVHILGGGPSALAAAYDLARKCNHEITIYTAGWRLGGKCASGMGIANRNEEHGLHLPLGFYENFFDQVRSAYQDVAGSLRIPCWDAAFAKRNTVVVEQLVRGEWREWSFTFPDRGAQTNASPGDLARTYVAGNRSEPRNLERMANRILERTLRYGTGLALSEARGVADVGKKLVSAVGGALGQLTTSQKMAHLQGAHQGIRHRLAAVDAAVSFEALKAHVYFELGLAGAAALMSLYRANRPLSDVDGLDLLEWLDQHTPGGRLSDETRNSAPIKMAYQLVFAYGNGDPDQPRLAAGVGARGILRLLFGYAEAFAYDVTAGMGESAITPYYLALQKTGRVTFRFFSRLTAVQVAAGRVTSFTLRRQATVKGAREYEPLTGPLPKRTQWPATPLYDQLDQGEALSRGKELASGGFDLESSYSTWGDVDEQTVPVAQGDFVVLAIPAPELAGVKLDVGPKQPVWKQMLSDVTGVATVSAQLWLTCAFAELGWPPTGIPVSDPALIGAFIDPLGNIADMSRLISREGWQDPTRNGAEDRPAGLVFLCGPFKEDGAPPPAGRPAGDYTAAAQEKARRIVDAWLQTAAPVIMPGISGGVLFVPTEAGTCVNPLALQYVSANVGPAHRYIPSFPGTIESRIRPDCRQALGVNNLLLAGDWTDNGFNAGCLEAAVTSGRLAARAVIGGQYPIYGEDDAHW